MEEVKAVLRELRAAAQRHELWLTLGWRDILSRYRRSWLGPLWITLSMGIVAGVMGSLYSAIMQRPMSEYIPYLTVGFIAWALLSSLVTEGTQAFVSNAATIKEIPVPLGVYVLRVAWRNLIVFGHNMLIYVALLVIFQLSPFPSAALAVPSLALILLNGLWVGLLFGLLNARFRDLTQLVNNLMRLVFFITPIIWFGESASGLRSAFLHFNPFYYFIEILRMPLLGSVPSGRLWVVALGITAVGWIVTLPIYARWRRSVAYFV